MLVYGYSEFDLFVTNHILAEAVTLELKKRSTNSRTFGLSISGKTNSIDIFLKKEWPIHMDFAQ
jgi:hypothetical protein